MSISEGMMLTCDICGTSQFFTEAQQQSADESYMKWQKFIIRPRFIYKEGTAICQNCSAKLNNYLRSAVYEIKKKEGIE